MGYSTHTNGYIPESEGPLPPPVIWAQRKNAVLLTFMVEDCKKPEIKVSSDKLYFKGIGGAEKKDYENTLELFGEIDPDKSKHFVRDRNVEFILLKKSDAFWPHLLKQKMKYHWLKVDFTRWKDEDDSEDEAGQNPDLEEMMRQMGGLGGGGGGGEGRPTLDDLEDDDSDDEDLPDLE